MLRPCYSSSSTRARRRVRFGATAASAAVAVALATTPAGAQAAQTGPYTPYAANLYNRATARSAVIGSTYARFGLTMRCWKKSDWVAGSDLWFKVTAFVANPRTLRMKSATGWIPANSVANQINVRRC